MSKLFLLEPRWIDQMYPNRKRTDSVAPEGILLRELTNEESDAIEMDRR